LYLEGFMRFYKIFTIIVLVLNLFLINASKSYAFSKIGNNYAQIRNVFEKQKFFLNHSKIDKLEELYSDDYFNNDGFDRETLFKLYQDTLDNHPDIKYDVIITKITADGDYATVKTVNKSTATTANKSSITNDNGLLSIDMETIFYLENKGGTWQIVSEQTISERTSLLYGECKNADIKLYSPEFLPSDKEYTVGLQIPEKYSGYAMGSLKKELITYPSQDPNDIFKTFDSLGMIERIFRTNKQGKNETVSASVAFAKPTVKADKSLDFKISGLGVLLQRVNIYFPQTEKNEK